ncbi:MAG: NERD domain-containing protein, partial [Candidatus Heimdallarchaeota archaeon]
PNKLVTWFILPKSKDDTKIRVLANITLKQQNKVPLKNIDMVIYNNNYGVYITPVKEDIRTIFTEKTLVSCTIQINQESFTHYYKQAENEIKNTNFKLIKNKEILLSGGNGKTNYEIYCVKNQIYIKHKGTIDSYGRFLISNELRRFFRNWFTEQNFIAKYKEHKFYVNSKVYKRNKSKKITKILQFQHYGPSKEVEIIITNSAIKFNKQTLKDLDIKRKLNDTGFKIKTFNSNHRLENEHKDKAFEKRIKKLLSSCFETRHNTSPIFSEVKIEPDIHPNTETFQEHMCIDAVIPIMSSITNESNLILVEIKTGNPKGKLVQEVEHDMARLLYLKSKLGNQNIIPIVVFNHDLKINNTITTKQFGKHAKVILIGSSEFQKMEKSPTILLDRINGFKKEDNQIKKLSLFENPDIEITGHRVSNHQGSEFEKYVSDLLENENQKVFSNVLLRCSGKDFEIDQIAIKKEEVSIVSCKDRSNWKSTSLNEEIKHYLLILNFRKTILGAQKGRLFVKTKNGILDKTI